MMVRMVAILSLLLVSGAGPKVQAQGYELRCRGKSGAFAIDELYPNAFSLRFTASSRAAGAGNEGLDPGTCAWIDRQVNSAEPLQIHFRAQPFQTTLIGEQLKDPNNYWSFVVINTNRGYFEANSQNPITQPAATPQSSSNADITTQRTKVDVTPRRGETTKADITPRRPVLNPSAPPPIDKQTAEQAKLVQLIRDVKIEDVTSRSFTVSFATIQPANSEVRVGIWSYFFSLDGKKH